MTRNISATELLHHLEAVSGNRCGFLVGHVMEANPENLTTGSILKLAVVDWLNRGQILSNDHQVVLLKVLGSELEAYAEDFDRLEQVGDTLRPHVALAVLDGRFVGLSSPTPLMYDLGEDTLITELPHHVLTTVTCDLGVLLIRLFSQIQRTRKLKDKPDAGKPAEPHRSRRAGEP